MSKSTVAQAMDRISVATPDSPIAVFRTPEGLDTMPANTLGTRKRIVMRDPALLGVFDNTMNQFEIRAALGDPVPRRPRVARGRLAPQGEYPAICFTGEF